MFFYLNAQRIFALAHLRVQFLYRLLHFICLSCCRSLLYIATTTIWNGIPLKLKTIKNYSYVPMIIIIYDERWKQLGDGQNSDDNEQTVGYVICHLNVYT